MPRNDKGRAVVPELSKGCPGVIRLLRRRKIFLIVIPSEPGKEYATERFRHFSGMNGLSLPSEVLFNHGCPFQALPNESRRITLWQDPTAPNRFQSANRKYKN